MDEVREKIIERRSYILSVLIATILVALNTWVLFEQFSGVLDQYFLVVIIGNIVICSLLANATYYTSRIRIDELYLSISFFLFTLIADYLVALVVLMIRPPQMDALISLFIGLGKCFFIFGIVGLKWRHQLSRLYNSVLGMMMVSVIIFALHVLAVYLIMGSNFNVDTAIFLINGFSVMLLVALEYELVLEERNQNSFAFLFAFSMMLIAQLMVTLSNNSLEIQIQSHILQGIGLGYFFYYVNRNNILIPEKEKQSLQRQFNLYSKNLKKIIDKKTHQVRDVNQKFIDELEYAKQIQQSLLPAEDTVYRDIRLVSGYFPCERLSGDFYDHYRLDDDNIALYLLDVSGHGISAALLTMFSNNYLKSNDKNQQLFRGLKPDRTLNYFYDQFNQMNFPDEMHMVAFYATLNLNTKMLTYCSAGLNCSPIRFRKNGKVEFLDKSEGFPICKLSDFVTPDYKSERIKLEKGDRLLFYTDGLIDLEKNNTYDLDTLIRFIKSHKHVDIETLNTLITGTINPIRESLNDDITYILVEI